MGNSYRNVGNMHVCTPTNQMADVAALLKIVTDFKRIGGKVPAAVEAALELAKTGKNAEDSLNIACEGLFKFYVSENMRCAKEAGYSNLDQYYAELRDDPYSERVSNKESCILNVERKWQLTNIDYTINLANPESAIRQFLRRTAEQVTGIVSKYIKKKTLEAGKQSKSPI